MRHSLLLLFLLTASWGFAAQFEPIVWPHGQLEAVKKAIAEDDTAYKSFYEKLMKEADRELDRPEPTVMDKPVTPPSGDRHDYMSMGRYWWPNPDTADGLPYVRRDGYSNPELEKYDRIRLGTMSKSVVRLAVAAYLSGNFEYGRKAVSILDTWFLSPRTKMNPNMNFGQTIPGHNEGKGRGEGVLDTYSLVELVDAILLLDHDGFMPRKKMASLRGWFDEYSRWMTGSEIGLEEMNAPNNHGLAYDVQLAVFAAFAGNDTLARTTIGDFPSKRLFVQVERDGAQPLELARTTGFGYSVFNITHMLDMSFVARNFGLDIFGAENVDGRSIKAAIDYLVPYMDNEQAFPYKQISKWEEVQWNFADQLYRAYRLGGDRNYRDLHRRYRRKSSEVMFRLLQYGG